MYHFMWQAKYHPVIRILIQSVCNRLIIVYRPISDCSVHSPERKYEKIFPSLDGIDPIKSTTPRYPKVRPLIISTH